MPLPEIIHVKLSSESAEYMSLTPVVARDMPLRELVELMLGVVGKEAGRIQELLRRGTLVSGASRFRWAGWDVDPDSLGALLATFPDPDPARLFSERLVTHTVLRGPTRHIEISRETAAARRFLRRRSFWDALIDAAGAPHYLDYSYKHRADLFRAEINGETAESLRRNANLLRYSSLEAQVCAAVLEVIDFYVARET
jgi:hypothetical protein